MRRIEVQKLSAEKFCRYGEYQDLLNDASLAKKSIFPGGFFADVVKLDLGTTTLPTVSVCQVRKSEQMVVSMVEAHKFTCEGLLPLDDDIVLFAGIPYPGRKLSSGPLEAFFVPKGTFVRLNPLILHGTQFPVNADTAHVLCLLPGRTFMNDMTAETLPEEERIELLFPENLAQ